MTYTLTRPVREYVEFYLRQQKGSPSSTAEGWQVGVVQKINLE